MLTGKTQIVRKNLRDWYARVQRDLPWRRTRDPYRIWVSEIMLQQTRVAAVIPYYERFLTRFPDVAALADAPEQDLLACWSGLGYYSRARNLQKAAKDIVVLGGFPTDYETIRALPGVGDYTAAAVASIAFDLPYAVLDGNVLRVLSRLGNDSGDIGSSLTRKRLQQTATQVLDQRHPAAFNQAVMELGATVCLPKQPQCLLCPVAECCEARAAGTENQLPIKLRRTKIVEIEETLLIIIQRDGAMLMRQRGHGESRLASFWELPEAGQLPTASRVQKLGGFRHSITHHRYYFHVVTARLHIIPTGFEWVSRDRLREIPLTTTTKKALRCYDL